MCTWAIARAHAHAYTLTCICVACEFPWFYHSKLMWITIAHTQQFNFFNWTDRSCEWAWTSCLQTVASQPIDRSIDGSISFENITTEIQVGMKLFAIVDLLYACWKRICACLSEWKTQCSPIHKSDFFLVIKSVSSCNITITKPPRAPTLLNTKRNGWNRVRRSSQVCRLRSLYILL